MFRKRIIASTVSIFLLGVIFALLVNITTFSSCAVFIISVIVSGIFLAVSARPNGFVVPKPVAAAAFAVAVFSLGALRVSLYNDAVTASKIYHQKTDNVVLQVLEVNDNSLDAAIESSKIGVPTGKRIRLYVNTNTNSIAIGDTVTASVQYKYRDTATYLSKGISLTASCENLSLTQGGGLFYSIRQGVDEKSKALFKSFEYAPSISKGVSIGDRSDINSYVFSLYKASGISHVLAISGLHISIITMSIYHVLLALTRRRAPSGIVASSIAIAYTALVGFTSGAVRATIMVLFYLLSRIFMRQSDGYTVIFIAMLAIVAVNPYSICSAGLQLSFLCTFGILLVEPFITKIITRFDMKQTHKNIYMNILFKIVTIIVVPTIISFISSVFSFPVLCASFDTVSYISPLTNILCVPLFTYAIEFTLLALLISIVSTPIATVIAFPAGVIFDFVTNLSQWLYDKDLGIMSVYVEYIAIPLVISIIMIAVLIFGKRHRTKAFVASSIAFCVSLTFCGVYNDMATSNTAVVEYGALDGEYAYTSYDGGVYIDLGGYTSNTDVIYKNGQTSLKHYAVLNYSTYSLKRFDYLSGNLKVSNVHLPSPKNDYDIKINLKIKELAKQRNCDIIYYNEYFSVNLANNAKVMVFGDEASMIQNTLVCFDICNKKIRVLDNAFSNKVNCDIAILTNDYGGDCGDILSGTVYASSEYAENCSKTENNVTFTDALRVEIDIKESGLAVYEP